MIRRISTSRRLLRKKVYKPPHSRHRTSQYKRENKNLVKTHQQPFKDMNGPNIKTRRRPKREVVEGFKMSYRYKYYKDENDKEDSEDDLESAVKN